MGERDGCGRAIRLSHCRSPLGFFSSEWREGVRGALWMGMRHGSFCLGCCWLLMALLFVAGVMNLAWVGRVAGLAMVGWGMWVIGGVVG